MESKVNSDRDKKPKMKNVSYHTRRSGSNQLEVATSKNGDLELTHRVTSKTEITALAEQTFKNNLRNYGLRHAAKGVGKLSRV